MSSPRGFQGITAEGIQSIPPILFGAIPWTLNLCGSRMVAARILKRGTGHPKGYLVRSMSKGSRVQVKIERRVLPTYLPALPDRNPMFLEKRVYQGSSGRVYPLPFTDRIAEQQVDRAWQVIWIENAYLRVIALAVCQKLDYIFIHENDP